MKSNKVVFLVILAATLIFGLVYFNKSVTNDEIKTTSRLPGSYKGWEWGSSLTKMKQTLSLKSIGVERMSNGKVVEYLLRVDHNKNDAGYETTLAFIDGRFIGFIVAPTKGPDREVTIELLKICVEKWGEPHHVSGTDFLWRDKNTSIMLSGSSSGLLVFSAKSVAEDMPKSKSFDKTKLITL